MGGQEEELRRNYFSWPDFLEQALTSFGLFSPKNYDTTERQECPVQ